MGELFQQAVRAQLSEQQAQRESLAEFSRRLEVSERLMSDGLSAIAKVLTASEHALEHLTDRLSRIEDVLVAEPGPADPGLSVAAASRIDACEAALLERLEAIDLPDRMETVAVRLTAMEASVAERLDTLWKSVSHGVDLLAKNMESAGQRYEAALDEARLSREAMRSGLSELEGSVRKFEEQTAAHLVELRDASMANETHLVELRDASVVTETQLGELRDASVATETHLVELRDASVATEAQLGELRDASVATEAQLGELRDASVATEAQLGELRDASVAAEAGILERIILESQTVATHFETVRPAVEAAAQAGPELENTLNELRELAERVAGDDSGETGPYSAEELLAPHEDDEENPLFQPPEETKIPERRFWGRDR